MEQRKSHINDKGNAQAGERPVRQNTDVMCDGGLSRSSEETSVMGVERRAGVVQLEFDFPTLGNQRMTNPILTKGIPITKQMVYEAYKKVKRNKGAAGIDKESLSDFDENLSKNLYKIWNRMSSGSFFPMGVREVSIPKADGKKRKLGIPTVSDRIAQEIVRTYVEPRLEKEFSAHSYGYRPLKNTHQALTAVRKNVREYAWVIDMDISAFFDTMSHEKLLLALEKHISEKMGDYVCKALVNRTND